MERPLAVLIVEDSASDAALNVRALERAGYKVSYEAVSTGEEMRAALERWTFDLVLSDHSLPQFDSIQALALIGEYGLDTPFIVVSGAIGEETAVALMKAGAQDYVMKDHLARLPSVVERALKETDIRRERRQAMEALRESEEKYRSLVESMNDSVYVVDGSLAILYANPKYLSRHGLRLEEAVGKNYSRFHSAAKVKEFSGNIKAVLDSGVPMSYEHVSPTDGRIFLRTLSPVKEPNGRAADKVTVISKDITDLKETEKKLRILMNSTITVISTAVEKRDPYTSGHQIRVAQLARAIAAEMQMSKDRIETIHVAALIHDLGKIAVPVEILNKPTTLSETEFSLIKSHCREGYEIIKSVDFPGPVARVVLEHHEKLDGSGYPQGLKREEMLLESRVLAVADVVEAMASHRPYRPALGVDAALREIESKRGTMFEPEAVDICLRLFKNNLFAWAKT